MSWREILAYACVGLILLLGIFRAQIIAFLMTPMCFHLPWHRIVSRWRLTGQSDKLTCSCGRAFGFNHHLGFVLPWEKVRDLYEGPGSILRPPR